MTSENNGMVMPVAPYYGGGYGGYGGNGMFDGNSGWWIILLLLVFGNGGWGNGFGGNGGGMYPWLVNGQQNGYSEVQRGFDQNAVITGITGVQNAVTNGFGNVQTALCNGFAGVNAGIANGFAQAEIASNARQMADMQQNFAIQSALQSCCCENRQSVSDLKATVLTENCADRAAVSDGIRDLLTSQNANTQRILDQLCQDKIDAKNETIAQLRQELAMRDLAASQGNQTAAIQAGQRALANEVEQYVLPTPRPAYIVQNPNCCQQNYGCGCGNGFVA